MTVARVNADHIITLWNVPANKEIGRFSGTTGAFSADGRTLASADGGTIKLWDIASGKQLSTLEEGLFLSIDLVAFSPDGRILVTATNTTAITLWDLLAKKKLRTFGGHPYSTQQMVFSPDGQTLATGKPDGTIHLWDVATGAQLRTFKGNKNDDSLPLVFSPDSRTFASAEGSSIKLWDAASGAELRSLGGHLTFTFGMAVSPDGVTLVTAGSGDTIRLWNVKTENLLNIRAKDCGLTDAAFSPDGHTLAIACGNRTVKLWSVDTGKEIRTLDWNSEVPRFKSVTFSPDGRMLAAGDSEESFVLWDTRTGKLLSVLGGHDETTSTAVFSADRRQLVTGSGEYTVRLWNLKDASAGRITRRSVRVLEGDYIIHSMALSPDGRTLAIGTNKGIELWDIKRRMKVAAPVGFLGNVYSVTFSPDGGTLAGGSDDNMIRLWDMKRAGPARVLAGHLGDINSLAFGPKGQVLVSGSSDGTIKLWDPVANDNIASVVLSGENDWAVTTPDGLFDGSPQAWRLLLWRFNNNTFDYAPIEAFFNEFYYPGLLSKIMSGKRPVAAKDISQKDRRQIPVKLTTTEKTGPKFSVKSRTVAIQVEVEEAPAGLDISDKNKLLPPSGARDVRLFRNGSLVKLWEGDIFTPTEKDGCKSQIPTSPQSPRRSICTATVPIVAGDNRFTAYAFNNDNVKSRDAETLTLIGDKALKRPATLYVLAVGVSQYANREYNVDYTTDDATSLASQLKLEQAKRTQYQSVEIKTLLNESATKENILAELKKLAAAVQPEDAVVVYFSGHGKASGDHFYLVPHDLGYAGSRDQLSNAGLQQILAHSISDLELEEAFRGIDAGQMSMIIDACNSGQALENKDEPRRGPMNTRGLAQLAYEKGMYIMTASQNVEEAFVSEKLKHSYLTYALVEEGLKTKAADANHNGEVVLREWFDYALTRVPKLREQTLQGKSLEEVTPRMKAVRSQKSQTPRVFYRREAEAQPLIVAKP
jgi:WD40 repeat protein